MRLALVLISLCVSCFCSEQQLKPPTCSQAAALLTQLWVNELGSHMRLEAAGGHLVGKYWSAVEGQADPHLGWYPLSGWYTCGQERMPTVAFAVGWRNASRSLNSSTAWSGQLLLPGLLRTTWLLTRSSDQATAWSSTLIGQDNFRAVP